MSEVLVRYHSIEASAASTLTEDWILSDPAMACRVEQRKWAIEQAICWQAAAGHTFPTAGSGLGTGDAAPPREFLSPALFESADALLAYINDR